MKIRKATKKDSLQILNIMKLNSPKYSKTLARKEINEMFSKSLIKPTYLVAEEKGKLAGCGGFIPSWVDNNVYDIFWLSVHPNFKNKGVGKNIVRHLIKEVRKIKDPIAKLIIISTKIPLFFRNLGFKKISKKYDRNYILMGIVLK
ncbi:MAG: GNAT family N-acetyltransferase [Nanoarchaeota archaeon]|nr:GNAT family N-acetyltransferase [Nanoarchaeota archaeon]